MGKDISIQYAKIFDTIKKLKVLEELVYRGDFSLPFEEMEDYFRNINFVHGNCIQTSDFFEMIYEDIDSIRKKITELIHSLSDCSVTFLHHEELSSEKMDQLLSLFPDTKILKGIRTEMFQPTLNNVVPPPYEEEKEINTIPIGVAIGVTGIAGSIGAVVVNEMYGPRTKKVYKYKPESFEEYHVSSTNSSDYDYRPTYHNSSSAMDYLNMDEDVSYSAVRKDREVDHFYGNQDEDLFERSSHEDERKNDFDDNNYRGRVNKEDDSLDDY